MEEVLEWMDARQSDKHVAVEAGNAAEVSRLAAMLAEGVTIEELVSEPIDGEQCGGLFVWNLKVLNWRVVHARYGLRGVRVGEASHRGPPLLRRFRRRQDVLFEISSDEEPVVRGIARNVVPRAAGMESVADATPIETSLTTVPATQTALVEAGKNEFQVGASVPLDVLDALEDDLDRVDVVARSSDFVLPVQNRFCFGLDSQGHGRSHVHGIGWFRCGSVPQAMQVPVEPPRHLPFTRLVLIPQSQSTPGSIQDGAVG